MTSSTCEQNARMAIKDKYLIVGHIHGVRPFAEFSAVEVTWDNSLGTESTRSPIFLLEVGHVLRCGDETFIVTSIRFHYDFNATSEQLAAAEDVLISLGRYNLSSTLVTWLP
jgi:hypothetical protein